MVKDRIYQKKIQAMNTVFSVWMPGEDLDELEAIGTEMELEIRRVERLLSRFDPQAELYRINQTAFKETLQISPELMGILMDAKMAWETTQFSFNAAWKSGMGMDQLKLDPKNLRVRFGHPDFSLDLGGYGKGYALKRCLEILEYFDLTDALLDAGGSSASAIGTNHGQPWEIHLEIPVGKSVFRRTFPLENTSFSSSTHRTKDTEISGASSEACVVAFCEDPVEAELLTTSVLVLGEKRSIDFLKEAAVNEDGGLTCLWYDLQDDLVIEKILTNHE
jgi:thiamine biosynthesis lipoprotein